MAGVKASAGRRQRGVFEVDAGQAIAELKRTWASAGYHGFCVDRGLWSAVSSAGEVFTGDTPDALSQAVRTHWQAMQGCPADGTRVSRGDQARRRAAGG